MTKGSPVVQGRLRGAGLAVAILLLGVQAAHPGHDTPAPPLPPGQAGVLVRLVWLPGAGQLDSGGMVKLESVELHRAGGGAGENWMSLPPLRPEFSARELVSGPVWVVSAPVTVGEFDQIRLYAGGRSQLPIGLRLAPGQWSIVTLYVISQGGRARGPLRLELKHAYPAGPS